MDKDPPSPPPDPQFENKEVVSEPPPELGKVEGPFGWVTALLRQPRSVADNLLNDKGPTGTATFFVVFIVCHLAYGLIMGLFSGEGQVYIVPMKMVLGTGLCALLCFPSLFIFACLSGVDVAPSKVFSILVGGLAMCSLLLVGFLPVSFIFTFSVESVLFMGFVHLAVWLASVYFACTYIRKGLTVGIPQGGSFFYFWNIVFILTLLQMSTTIRPLLGPEDKSYAFFQKEKKFFLEHWGDAMDDHAAGEEDE